MGTTWGTIWRVAEKTTARRRYRRLGLSRRTLRALSGKRRCRLLLRRGRFQHRYRVSAGVPRQLRLLPA
ncbi:MAG TPA: hypothetical protein VGM83_01235 [Devosiaceae bacterium]|jgi:hypothetical protein